MSPSGEILPHVDNIEASGSVIIGLSLGAERVLRLERQIGEDDDDVDLDLDLDLERSGGAGGRQGWDIRLTNGSVYVQRYVRGRLCHRHHITCCHP